MAHSDRCTTSHKHDSTQKRQRRCTRRQKERERERATEESENEREREKEKKVSEEEERCPSSAAAAIAVITLAEAKPDCTSQTARRSGIQRLVLPALRLDGRQSAELTTDTLSEKPLAACHCAEALPPAAVC